MRNTRQKNLIFEIIDNSYDHLSAYQIYDIARLDMPNISLGTVYRNLSNLVKNKKIREIVVDGTLHFDRNDMHAHFICNNCGDIIDVFNNIIDDNSYIDGNLVMDYEIKLKGICKKCVGGNDNNGIKRK